MRIEIKRTKCEEIGIFCRNIAEKFILKFAKLFYIKKTRGFMPFSSTICDFYNKKLKFWIRRLVAYFHVWQLACLTRVSHVKAYTPPICSETDLIRKLMFFISLLNDITAETRSAFSSLLQKYFVEPWTTLFIFFSQLSFLLLLRRQSWPSYL